MEDANTVNAGSKKSLHGNIYQVKVLMLHMYRCLNLKYKFTLSTEVEKAEKFDDIVLCCSTGKTDEWRFLQVKHKQNELEKITRGRLLNTKQGSFSLKKYFGCYRRLREKHNATGEYILYTNIDFAENTQDIVTVVERTDPLMDVTVSGKTPKYCKIDMNKDKKIYDTLKTSHEADALAEKLAKLINDSKKITCTGPIKRYHAWLVRNVFDKTTKKLRTDMKGGVFTERLVELLGNRDVELTFSKAFFDENHIKECGKNLTDIYVKDDEITDFMNNLTFAVNQPDVDKLGEIINKEVGENEMFNLLRADLITDAFFTNILNWVKEKESRKHTQETGAKLLQSLKEKMEHLMNVNVDLIFTEKLKKCSTNFKSINNELKEFIDNSGLHRLNFVCSEPFLGTLQIYFNIKRYHSNYKAIDSTIFVDTHKVISIPGYMAVIEKLFQMKDVYKLLIIQCHESIEAHNIHIQKLLHISEKTPAKKIILISTKPLIDECSEVFINFTHLAHNKQRHLKDKTITFQGIDIPLGELILSNSLYKIEGKFLTNLLLKKDIHIGKKLTEVDNLYVDRGFLQNIEIKKDILKSNGGISGVDAIVITGYKNNLEIKNQIVEFHTTSEWNENMFEEDTRLLHWLKLEKDKLNWHRSNCSLKSLHPFLAETKTIKNIEEMLEKNEKFCIISDIAGMGKSTVLNKLANEIKAKHKNHWVVTIDLNLEKSQIVLNRNVNNDFEGNNIQEFIKDLTNIDQDSSLKNDLFIDNIMDKSRTPAIILIDGFDEICPEYDEIVTKFIGALTKLNVKNIVVTTRPHMKDKLEEVMKVFSHTLEPFPRCDQIQYLTSFFKCKLTSESENPFENTSVDERLKNYVKFVVDKVSYSMNDRELQFNGIPLHLNMVAEIFVQGTGENYKWESCEQFLTSNNENPNLPDRLEIIELYDLFYKKKIHDFTIDKSKEKHENLNQSTFLEEGIERLFKHQQKLSLKLFFTEEEIRILRGVPEDISLKMKNQLLKIGFISSLGDQNNLEFTHRTYAEYFASNFLKNVIENPNEESNRILFTKVLLHIEFNLIRSFLNSYIAESNVALIEENCSAEFWATNKFYKENGQSILHVLAEEGNVNLIDFILNNLNGNEELKKSFLQHEDKEGQTALFSAMKSGSIETIEKLYSASTKDKDKYGRSFLYVAALHQHWKIVEWLLDRNTPLSKHDINVHRAFYYAAIYGNIDVVEYLLENVFGKEYVKNCGVLPHIIKYGQLELLKFFVKEKYVVINSDYDETLPALLYAAFDSNRRDIIYYLLEQYAQHTVVVDHILAEYNQTYLLEEIRTQENKVSV